MVIASGRAATKRHFVEKLKTNKGVTVPDIVFLKVVCTYRIQLLYLRIVRKAEIERTYILLRKKKHNMESQQDHLEE